MYLPPAETIKKKMQPQRSKMKSGKAIMQSEGGPTLIFIYTCGIMIKPILTTLCFYHV